MQAVRALRGAGIPVILLKGRAIAGWLYPDGDRDYRDVDLLVPPAERDAAEAVLAGLGYRRAVPGASAAEYGPNEVDLRRADGLCVDLHHNLIGCAAERCWPALRGRTAELPLAGYPIPVLDVPARALHLALHAAQNGLADERAAEDLRRGLAALDAGVWREAASVAEDAGATEAFAAGLLLTPAGRHLAGGLGLRPPVSAEPRLRAASAGPRALALQRLLDTPGAAARARFAARKLWPSAALVHHRVPTARASRAALLRARLSHLACTPLVLARAVAELASARRQTSP